MWQANVFTIFPEAFPGTLGVSLIGDALAQKKWNLNLIDLKKYPVKSDRIDSIPYGGGAGMILSPLTFEKAFNSLSADQKRAKRIYFSPRGRQMTQDDLQRLSRSEGVTFLCGRYEGVDQRILDYYEFEEISIGDFVLLGGESAAMTIIEGIVRLLPEVVGNNESIYTDSFQEPLLEYHQYTRPKEFHYLEVPEILRSGDHEKINEFRLKQSIEITKKRRPDVWAKYIAKKLKNK
ncbi:MAG: tRNA (guanosine(37)-N1)-methyltransferase TrmD [Alphaproteobacteria bacterium]|nr:tRNA (guanosine(37)-N1)-methyltransferase TrmD [Alphaproteobacteria bacterium]